MSVTISQLDSGIMVATQQFPHTQSVNFGIWVRSGSRNEMANQQGLSHFLEHMAFKGTNRFSAKEIAEKIENVGGDINAATSIENTAYHTRLLKPYLEIGLDILTDILANSTFDANEISREKQVVMQELGASIDTPSDIIFDHFTAVAYPNQALGRAILGTEETINSFTAEDLRSYMDVNYKPTSMLICATGPIEHNEFLDKASPYLPPRSNNGLKQFYEAASYQGGDYYEERDLQDTQLLIGFEAPTCTANNFYATKLLSVILGGGMSSRLFQNIREELGLCYSIYSFHWALSDTGLFGIYAASSAQKLDILVDALIEQLRNSCKNIETPELERAKVQYASRLIMSQESHISRVGQIAKQTLLFGHPLSDSEILAKINQITCSDIEEAAQQIFLHSRPTTVVMGKKKLNLTSDEIKARLLQ